MNAGEKLKERRDAERAERRRQERLDERAQERADREQEEQRAEERRQQAAQEEAAWRDAEDRERERRQERLAQLRRSRIVAERTATRRSLQRVAKLAEQQQAAQAEQRHELLRGRRRAEDEQTAAAERREKRARAERQADAATAARQERERVARTAEARDAATDQRAAERRAEQESAQRAAARVGEAAEERSAARRAEQEASDRLDARRREQLELRREQVREAERQALLVAGAREARLRAQAELRASAEAAAERAAEARRAEAERRAQARRQEQAAEERRRELQAAAAAARRAELAEPEPLELPWLRTEDNQVVAWGGEPAVLRGVTASGLGSAAGPLRAALALGDDEIADLSERWGANMVRLPFAAAAPLGEPLLQELDDLVAALAAAGVYTLLAEEDAPSAQAWTLLADRYQGTPSVLFEPGDASLELVRAIRSRHASSLLLLPANGLEGLPIHNIVYVLPRAALPEVGLAALVSRLPLLVTSWSETGFDAGTVTANLLARLGVGWSADGWNATPPLGTTRFGLAVRRALATPTRPALSAFP